MSKTIVLVLALGLVSLSVFSNTKSPAEEKVTAPKQANMKKFDVIHDSFGIGDFSLSTWNAREACEDKMLGKGKFQGRHFCEKIESRKVATPNRRKYNRPNDFKPNAYSEFYYYCHKNSKIVEKVYCAVRVYPKFKNNFSNEPKIGFDVSFVIYNDD